MTHAEKMLAFLSIGTAEVIEGFFECAKCMHPAGKAIQVGKKIQWTCSSCGEKNES